MAKNLAALIVALLGVGLTWLCFMWGWGIEPKSWFWIVTLTVAGAVCALIAKGVRES